LFHLLANRQVHLAYFNHPTAHLPDNWAKITGDAENVTCLRSCLMKPEHEQWIDNIWDIIDEVTTQTQ
jgi:hypothetical protein